MVAVIQRCIKANVKVDNKVIAKIDQGLVVLLGIQSGDDYKDASYVAKKIINLRIYNDSDDKMNLSIKEINGSILVISQFTLCANTKKGRRPSFINAASTPVGEKLYKSFISNLLKYKLKVKTGKFGANMDVALINQGPATFIIDSEN